MASLFCISLVAKALCKSRRIQKAAFYYECGSTRFLRVSWKHAVASFAQPFRKHADIFLVFSVFALGLGLRCAGVWYSAANSLELDTDAKGYMLLAKDILKLSYTAPREPAFPLVVASMFLVFGSSVEVLRMTSAVLGSLVILASYRLGESANSRIAGLFLATMVALDPYLFWNSPRGLREEMFSLLLICLISHAMSSARRQFDSRAGLIDALLTAGLILTRLEGTVIALAVCIFAVWYSNVKTLRQPIAYLIIVILSVITALMGWGLFSWIQFGDPFLTITVQGSRYYSQEFGVEKHVTALEYILHFHSPIQLAFIWITGILRISNFLYSYSLGAIGFILTSIGSLYLLRLRRTVLVHLTVLIYISFIAAFIGISSHPIRPSPWLIDFRHLYPMFPLFYSFVAVAVTSMRQFFASWDRTLASYGLSLEIPIANRRKIRFLPSHLCYGLFLCVIYHQIQIWVWGFPFSLFETIRGLLPSP